MLSQHTMDLLAIAWPRMLAGAVVTIQIAAAAVVVGALIGAIFGVATSKRLRVPFLAPLINGYVLIIRGTPIYVQILICYFALPDLLGLNLTGFSAGVLALGINSVAYVGEIIRSGINNVSTGQWDAAYVLGYSFFGTMWHVVMPQVARNVLIPLTNEFVVLIKETSLLSAIGLVELTQVTRALNARYLNPLPLFLMAALFYLVLTTTVSLLANRLEKRLSHD